MSNALIAGYQWSQRFEVTRADGTPIFTSSTTWTAPVRADPNQPVLTTLTSANGQILRVDDDTIDIVISGTLSASWGDYSTIYLDLIRTDTDPDQHIGVRISIPVVKSL